MIIGFDYFGTITRFPSLFKAVAEIIHAHQGQVHVISAIGKREPYLVSKYMDGVEKDLDEFGIEVESVVIVEFERPDQVPNLKLNACKELKIEYFFDDRSDVCGTLIVNGIKACHVKKNWKVAT